jgi:hypothetical protein
MKKERQAGRDECYAAWVGFDWGDQEHIWVLQWADTGERGEGAWSRRQKRWVVTFELRSLGTTATGSVISHSRTLKSAGALADLFALWRTKFG